MSPSTLTSTAIALAAQQLRAGELVAFPTETVYGLGADACNDAAVAKIFDAKGRPSDHPLIVHIADTASALHFASNIPAFAQDLMAAFWPGPLTLIVPRRASVASASAAQQNSIGLRCPAHPMAQALLQAASDLGVHGIAAPSANRFGRVSPTKAEHVRQEFMAAWPQLLVLDGGDCELGIESCIVDCSRGVPVLLRPGVLTLSQLQKACGVKVHDAHDFEPPSTPRASGTLASHYAPRARVKLFSNPNWSNLEAAASGQGLHVVRYQLPQDPLLAAHELFAQLRTLDATGVDEIWIETPPSTQAWAGVRDRLQRAAF